MEESDLKEIYRILLEEFGPQKWWPAETRFEVIVGAFLTQQTKWSNVERAIGNLRQAGLLEPYDLAKADIIELEEMIRCCGFYRQKAARLRNAAQFLIENDMYELFNLPIDQLRKILLSLNGVGNETADSILLYAADKPKFVIDAYTTRIMSCIGVEGNYGKLQKLFESALPQDVTMFKEYHALIVEYGKSYCGKKRCEECILIKGHRKGTMHGKEQV
ncbi:MAG: endonuclease III [Methanomethylovorans sp. PtaU1.Bin093]|jgi:endonuclease-3 related protein|uniref:endonuclease III domain-containing protein n=1 Tax=Methanomethylovorans sp. PtaU1.Bin093 TaxID=1811679 RepID=UPI0009C834D4|nr:endonuclease [Methanomethylovorans sp. PtaU1.Bin093]OPY20327.1 MAG: endonuclease III [Methanomethylovorans sp. PtaU1.Bin093]